MRMRDFFLVVRVEEGVTRQKDDKLRLHACTAGAWLMPSQAESQYVSRLSIPSPQSKEDLVE
jgi:hypothetical protein